MKEKTRTVEAGGVKIGSGHSLALIAGPCVVETADVCMEIAGRLVDICAETNTPFIFKASYDKANRSSINSYRGPGLEEGLNVLDAVKSRFGVPVLTDVHSVEEVAPAAAVADILQLPAFLCRQTDLAVALGNSGRVVNVKKGQFLAPADIGHVIEKIRSTGNENIIITERGTSFGYNNLVSDMRSLPILRGFGYPVMFDATHSVQLPGAAGGRSGGDSRWVPYLARAAVAAGCDAVFMETHVTPEKAMCDRDNTIAVSDLAQLWKTLRRIDEIAGR